MFQFYHFIFFFLILFNFLNLFQFLIPFASFSISSIFFYRCCQSDLKITQNTCALFRLDIQKKRNESGSEIYEICLQKYST